MDLNANLSDVKLDLNKTPPWARTLMVVIIPLIAVVIYYFVQYQPKNQKIDKLIAQIRKQENEISVKETKARRLAVLKAENDWLKARLRELQEQLPDEQEVSGLLRQISDLGLAAGLEINSWNPRNRRTNPSGLYDEIPVAVTVTAGYHNLGEFFSSISAMTRIVNVSNISMALGTGTRTSGDGSPPLNVKFNATAFTTASSAQGAGRG